MSKFVQRGLLAVAIASAAIVALPEPSEAQRRSRPETKWCLRGPTGGQACAFHTLEQCRKAALGTGSTCMRNPRFGR
jgi:hypothetical protein